MLNMANPGSYTYSLHVTLVINSMTGLSYSTKPAVTFLSARQQRCLTIIEL